MYTVNQTHVICIAYYYVILILYRHEDWCLAI